MFLLERGTLPYSLEIPSLADINWPEEGFKDGSILNK